MSRRRSSWKEGGSVSRLSGQGATWANHRQKSAAAGNYQIALRAEGGTTVQCKTTPLASLGLPSDVVSSPATVLSIPPPPPPRWKREFPCPRASTPVARRHCKVSFAKSLQSSWAQERMPGTSANCSCFLICNLVNKSQSDKSPGGPARNSPVPHHLRVSALHDSELSLAHAKIHGALQFAETLHGGMLDC